VGCVFFGIGMDVRLAFVLRLGTRFELGVVIEVLWMAVDPLLRVEKTVNFFFEGLRHGGNEQARGAADTFIERARWNGNKREDRDSPATKVVSRSRKDAKTWSWKKDNAECSGPSVFQPGAEQPVGFP